MKLQTPETIQTLAWQCPYIGGTAVYKARSLNAMLEPGAYYDDLTICNYAGVYRGGDGLFKQENEFLETLKHKKEQEKKEYRLYTVFPNPASGYVKIQSNADMQGLSWQLHDLAGKTIERGQVHGKVMNFTIPLRGIAQGVYQLVIQCQGGKHVCKLIIE